MRETTVRDVDFDHADATDAAHAIVRGSRAGGDAVEIAARMVIDASGRTGVIARRGLRQDEPGHQTVALAAAWRAPHGWSLPDETHTLVEAFEDGWAWSIPVSRSVRYFTVMVDRGVWRGGARGYESAIAKTTHLRVLLEQGELDGAPWGAEASLYAAERFSGPRFLLAGDAGATLDPLSSFGVKKALASGWMAAIVTNTCLQRPEMADAARALFDAREREVYAAGLAGAVAFARDAVSTFPGVFWRTRAQTNLDGRAMGPIEDRFRHDERVRAAFERLRASGRAMLRACDGVRIEPRPMIDGREVVLADSLILSAAPEGIRYLGGVNLPALIALARGASVPELFDAYLRTQPAVDLARFLTALAVLLSTGSVEIVAV
jgi:hypothetical protein